ncbi:NRPS-like enzyme [Sporothrix brasiliensis 5110]|uniref:NRPS-like enzyme n=1 Tax=Sporothrix brasiliensis 5110 TaxID=1398154 RepID=A0A0C2ISR6_9PEZI|nr:NRPS-like enzyme [Sporothrix brasiliensis 5110]KIH89895.1 NRPS-like enzyme [Sporothrix brasiliensis 5110]
MASTRLPMDTDKDLVALFRQQVHATPNAVAAEDDATTWTYAELDRATDLVADHLRSVYGVGRDVLVGVLMGHTVQYVVACLAALKAGGAFLVLEVAYPPGLLADVIEDAHPPVILTSAEYADKVPAHIPRILLERATTLADLAALTTPEPTSTSTSSSTAKSTSTSTQAASPSPLPSPTDLDRLAFVSYSSGSTGRPKGICNPHSAPVQSYALRFQVSDLGPGDRVACNVFFVWEILRPLLRGATVLTIPDDASYDPVGLVAFLAEKKATETLMTPTLLATVLGRYPDLATRLPHLRTLWFNGEVVSVDLARRAATALAGVRLLNCYSASETHEIACGDIRTTLATLPADATVCPVGPPLLPAHTYVLDEDGRPVAPGVGGELYVGGPLLARGYLHRPETTADVFLPDVFAGEGRMYRTGDKARILPSSGEIEISGRVGGMIKVRGYTVHPAAVESAIVKHLAVRSCVVLADKEGLERQLVAYVVREAEGSPNTGADGTRAALEINADGHSPLARRLLADHLAHYMIPVFWVELDTLPTHKVSGKVDIKGLPAPSPARAGPSPPVTPPAESMAQILWAAGAAAAAPPNTTLDAAARIDPTDIRRHWAACLGMESDETLVELARTQPQHDFDFFDLGGHSLALAELSNRLSASYGCNVPLLALMRAPTLAGHVAAVTAAARAAHATTAAAVDNGLLLSMLRDDSTLPEDLAVPDAPKAAQSLTDPATTDIFLTGATGFLGAFLLAELLATTSATVHCLVRRPAASASLASAAGMPRVRKHLLGLGLWQDSMADRIHIVPGDLALPSLGLSDADFDSLATRVQAVVHAGAHVNLVYPYDALRDANVGGTKEVLRLVGRGGATLHYISTNGVLPPAKTAWTEDDTPIVLAADVVDKIADGYGQTKWAAEQLVLQAGRRGLPTRIYRPGTLGGHSATGATNPRDVVTALVVESLRIGYAPNVDGWRVEMTPVDAACRTIVQLASTTTTADNTIHHVGDPDALLAKDLFARLAVLGYPTEAVDWDEWVARWNEDQSNHSPAAAPAARHDEDLSPMDVLRAGMPSVDFLKLVILLDDTKTRSLLLPPTDENDKNDETELKQTTTRPQLDLGLLATYTRHFYSRGWLAHGPKAVPAAAVAPSVDRVVPLPKGPLAGRVAVVVGASSGIGAAIATALASDGAHVALGARRLGELKTLQAALEAQFAGVRVVARPTDVTSAAQVQALVAAATDALGPIDILVVCAGVMYFTMMASVRTDEWERTVDVNCKGLLHCLAATVPGMLSRAKPHPPTPAELAAGGGDDQLRGRSPHIVCISSDAGRKVFPGLGVYSGSKFFVEAVLQSLRLETAGTGLRVTSVQPGNTATELLSLSTDPEAMDKYGTPTGAEVLAPADVASAVMYALRQPAHVAVNEVMIEPRDEPI